MANKLRQKYLNMPIQARASLWALFCGILQKGISVITTPIFTRLLSTSEYGQFNVYGSWLNIISIVVTLSLSAGVFEQGLVKFEDKKKVLTSSLQGLTFTLVAFWFCVYLVFHNFWNELFGLTTIQMVSMFISIWLGAIYGFWYVEKKNEYDYKPLLIYTLITSVLSPAVSITTVYFSDDKVTTRIVTGVAMSLIFNTWMFFTHIKEGKRFFSAEFWKYALLFNLPLVPHYLSQVILNSSDRIMIEKMVGEAEAGIYSLAYSLSMLMLIIVNALMQSIGPWLYRKIKAKKNKEIAPITYSTLIGVAVVNMILIALAPEAVKIFSPPEYYEAIWIIPPVAVSVYYIYCYDIFARFAFYYEKQGFITVASIIGAIANIILNYICINKFGYIAAGYTTLVCYMIYALCHYQFMNKVCDKFCDGNRPYNGKIIALISAVFTACGLLMLLTYNHIIIRYSIIGIIAVICLVERKKITAFFKKIISLKNAD